MSEEVAEQASANLTFPTLSLPTSDMGSTMPDRNNDTWHISSDPPTRRSPPPAPAPTPEFLRANARIPDSSLSSASSFDSIAPRSRSSASHLARDSPSYLYQPTSPRASPRSSDLILGQGQGDYLLPKRETDQISHFSDDSISDNKPAVFIDGYYDPDMSAVTRRMTWKAQPSQRLLKRNDIIRIRLPNGASQSPRLKLVGIEIRSVTMWLVKASLEDATIPDDEYHLVSIDKEDYLQSRAEKWAGIMEDARKWKNNWLGRGKKGTK